MEMEPSAQFGKLLIILGIMLIVVGGGFLLSGKFPLIGRLPGDIIIEKKNFTLYFPVVTCIVVSLVLTFVFWLIGKR